MLNGTGSLDISSARENGVTPKDDLKITGGALFVSSALDGPEANDSIRIADGELIIDADKGALHSEYDEDDAVGFIYIAGGTLDIAAGDDAIHGTTVVQADGGTIDIEASSPFDCDGVGELYGGTITANGELITEPTQSRPPM